MRSWELVNKALESLEPKYRRDFDAINVLRAIERMRRDKLPEWNIIERVRFYILSFNIRGKKRTK